MRQKIWPRRAARWGLAALLCAAAFYVAVAYGVEPILWRHYENQRGVAVLEHVTRTSIGIPGDAINVGLEGSQDDVICAIAAAGWSPADPVTLTTSLRLVGSVLFNRAYVSAPVSDLYYQGRRQDLAFQKPSGKTPSTRHHVRLWKAIDKGEAGLPVWLGAATYDVGVGVSHYTGQVTHHVAADIDAERDLLGDDLARARKVEASYLVSGVGPMLLARNGGGDPYFTDGEIGFSRLVVGCKAHQDAPIALPAPSAAAAKNQAFGWAARLWRALP